MKQHQPQECGKKRQREDDDEDPQDKGFRDYQANSPLRKKRKLEEASKCPNSKLTLPIVADSKSKAPGEWSEGEPDAPLVVEIKEENAPRR
jgi:hypothetical protein